MVAAIEEIKEDDPKQEISETLRSTLIVEEKDKDQIDEETNLEGQISGEGIDDIIFGSAKADKQVIEELEKKYDDGIYHSAEATQEIDNQIITDSNEEAYIDDNSLCYKVGGSRILNVGVPNLPITDVYANSTIDRKLRERGSLETQQGDNLHRPLIFII
uniref:Uncharacterized protein n=1 Tax=Solanum tuberosum TaxID=4113 RepID=M0ZZP7_SOLTU